MADYEQIKTMLDNLEEWKEQQELQFAGEFSIKKHKLLCVTLSGSYRVYKERELVFETMQPFAAVEKYLDI